MEKISKQVSASEEVNNNVKLLTEMVMSHSQGGASARSRGDLMKELYQCCERMKPALFQLASDTEDNGEVLAEILQAKDNVTQYNLYKQLLRGERRCGSQLPPWEHLGPAGPLWPGSPSCRHHLPCRAHLLY